MDTTPPDREFCARGEQLYVEAQLDLACWRRNYPQIDHQKAEVAARELAVDVAALLLAQAPHLEHEQRALALARADELGRLRRELGGLGVELFLRNTPRRARA